jgi:hypothetical protein
MYCLHIHDRRIRPGYVTSQQHTVLQLRVLSSWIYRREAQLKITNVSRNVLSPSSENYCLPFVCLLGLLFSLQYEGCTGPTQFPGPPLPPFVPFLVQHEPTNHPSLPIPNVRNVAKLKSVYKTVGLWQALSLERILITSNISILCRVPFLK